MVKIIFSLGYSSLLNGCGIKPRLGYTRQWYSARCCMAQRPGQWRWQMAGSWMQHTTNGSEKYKKNTSLGGTRLQGDMETNGTGRYGKIIRRRRLRCMGHVAWMDGERPWTGVRRGSSKEADRERTVRKLYAKTSDAWIWRGVRQSILRRTERDGRTASPDVQQRTGWTKY